jgi:hypothetical protein
MASGELVGPAEEKSLTLAARELEADVLIGAFWVVV